MKIPYYIVDVFTSAKYGGNQLAVFIDFENNVSDENMQKIARELNFAEITFIKQNNNNQIFKTRIFTPEYEIPFAGHPSLGTAFVISKYILSEAKKNITLAYNHVNIDISLDTTVLNKNPFFEMIQSQPEFIDSYKHHTIAKELDLDISIFDTTMPIQQISTGLLYIIIPIQTLAQMEALTLNSASVISFLKKYNSYKTNSPTGLSTSLYFVCTETYEQQNDFNVRMFCIENNHINEDAATGSAAGCLLAYLLQHKKTEITATIEQGFRINRKSYLKINGSLTNNSYLLKVKGQVAEVSAGTWLV